MVLMTKEGTHTLDFVLKLWTGGRESLIPLRPDEFLSRWTTRLERLLH